MEEEQEEEDDDTVCLKSVDNCDTTNLWRSDADRIEVELEVEVKGNG